MNGFLVTLLTVLVSLLVLILGLIKILSSPSMCNYIFNRDESKCWDMLIKNADKFEYFKHCVTEDACGEVFVWGQLKAIVWKSHNKDIDNKASIHYTFDTDCFLCSYDKKKSEKMAQLLMKKIS